MSSEKNATPSGFPGSHLPDSIIISSLRDWCAVSFTSRIKPVVRTSAEQPDGKAKTAFFIQHIKFNIQNSHTKFNIRNSSAQIFQQLTKAHLLQHLLLRPVFFIIPFYQSYRSIGNFYTRYITIIKTTTAGIKINGL